MKKNDEKVKHENHNRLKHQQRLEQRPHKGAFPRDLIGEEVRPVKAIANHANHLPAQIDE